MQSGSTFLPNIRSNPTRIPEVIDVDEYMSAVVDVDKMYMKYEVTDEDGIESIDRDEYRRAKQVKKRAAQSQDRARSTSTAGTSSTASPTLSQTQLQQLEERRQRHAQASGYQNSDNGRASTTLIGQSSQPSFSKRMLTPNLNSGANNTRASTSSPASFNRSTSQQSTRIQSQNSTRPSNFPSTIGRAIDDMRANKRDLPSLDTNPQKRRKIESIASTSSFVSSASPVLLHPRTMGVGRNSAPVSSSKVSATPLGIPSNSIPTTPSSPTSRKRSPPSPDISFVPYVAKRKKGTVATNSTVAENSRSKSVIFSEIIELSSSDDEVAQMLSTKKRKPGNDIRNSTSRSLSMESMVVDSFASSIPSPSPTFSRTTGTHTPRQLPPLPPPESGYETDSESSDDGWDLNHPTRWKPMEIKNRLENDVVDDIDLIQLNIRDEAPGERLPSARYIHSNTAKWNDWPQLRHNGSPEFIWDKLRLSDIRWKPRVMPIAMRSMSHYMRPFELDFYLHKLTVANSFKKAPGSINKVEQKGDWTVIASASIGGLPDSPDDEFDTSVRYNRPGSLLTWNKKAFTPVGHRRYNHHYSLNNSESWKYYAVNDVKFDPIGNMFASSGADKKVRFWTLMEDPNDMDPVDESEGQACPWKNIHHVTFKVPPHELAFKPGLPGNANRSILAIAGKKLFVKAYSEDEDTLREESISDIALMPSESHHIVGSISWGHGPTSDHLFVSTEPTNPTRFDGVHKVYDIERRKTIYQLDGKEAGDALAVDPIGTRLALSTRAAPNKHILRLFDVKRQLFKPTASFYLDKFPQLYDSFEGEVTCSSFSPDEMYLTLARNDNTVHMYDLRFLEKGPIFRYAHFGESKVESTTSTYGVTKAEWLHSKQTGRMALVTGGEDGCVRLWDPSKSEIEGKNGNIIAEVNSDIAHFSIGDIYKGEHQLIVGDCSGEVTIFDTLCI